MTQFKEGENRIYLTTLNQLKNADVVGESIRGRAFMFMMMRCSSPMGAAFVFLKLPRFLQSKDKFP